MKFESKKKRMEESLRQNPTQELMTPERERILAMGIVELSQKLKSGDLDPVAVMEAYQVFKINKVELSNASLPWWSNYFVLFLWPFRFLILIKSKYKKRFHNPYHSCHNEIKFMWCFITICTYLLANTSRKFGT